MKLGINLIFILAFSVISVGQSGRIKPAETPTPRPDPQRRPVTYFPTQDRGVLPVLLPAASPTPKPKDDPDEVITVESTLVPIPVSVLDNGGRAVMTLKLSDFELQIDGKTAEISELSRSETPIRLAMLFDNSSSVMIAREFEKDAAIKFFRRIIRPEKDLAALYSVATVTHLEQPFTANISSLTRAIEMFAMPVGATALLDGLVDSSNYLREVSGRRVIVIVSDGDDTASDSSFELVMKELQLANAQVYVVKTTDFENYKRTGSRGGNANLRQLSAERRMSEIARQTGGSVYSPLDERELDEAFRQISAELTQQYILSYYPENETDKHGQFRTISLSVKGRPNLNVRTRNGYYVLRR
ncbi:MAG TPA: VWA domain-containing protein [Pyrinomonadaceae bacterium]|nr:VWA domain-containing protein [Pyrinomonadaceae bacterium]